VSPVIPVLTGEIVREGEACGVRCGLEGAWSFGGIVEAWESLFLCDLWISIVISKGRTAVGWCVLVFVG
jgi:hypothetical protein